LVRTTSTLEALAGPPLGVVSTMAALTILGLSSRARISCCMVGVRSAKRWR
jgi:hypothetical protein